MSAEGVPVAYRVERDVPNMDEHYERLIGPDGKRVTTLTEPEDRNFYRDLAPVLDLLNAQHAAIAHPAAASAEREALAARLARAEEERDEAVGRTSMDIYSHGRVGEARMESIVYDLGVCSDWYFDDYDYSVEMLGVRNGWLPTKEDRDLLSATGLCVAFLSYLDGTGVLVYLNTGEHGPCSPKGTTSDKSALVAKLERERDEAVRALSSRATKEVDRA